MAKNVSIMDFSDELTEIIREYTEDVSEAIEEKVDETAKKVLKETKRLTPRRTGNYRKGFKITKQDQYAKTKRIIWNKKYYSLIHLLEFGHKKFVGVAKVKTGPMAGTRMHFTKAGKIQPTPHMRPAYQKYGAALPDHIKKIIRTGGGS